MVSFKTSSKRASARDKWLKQFYIARKKDTWDEVLPYLWAEISRRSRGEGVVIPEHFYQEELAKYYMDYGTDLIDTDIEKHRYYNVRQ